MKNKKTMLLSLLLVAVVACGGYLSYAQAEKEKAAEAALILQQEQAAAEKAVEIKKAAAEKAAAEIKKADEEAADGGKGEIVEVPVDAEGNPVEEEPAPPVDPTPQPKPEPKPEKPPKEDFEDGEQFEGEIDRGEVFDPDHMTDEGSSSLDEEFDKAFEEIWGVDPDDITGTGTNTSDGDADLIRGN